MCSLASQTGLESYIRQDSTTFLESAGVSRTFIDTLLNSIARNNYNQNVDTMHALAALIALMGDSDDLFCVAEGNSAVVQNLARSSNRIRTSTTVVKVASSAPDGDLSSNGNSNSSDATWRVTYSNSNGVVESELHDVVVLCVPVEHSGIEIPFEFGLSRVYKHVKVQVYNSFPLNSKVALMNASFVGTMTGPISSISNVGSNLFKVFWNSDEPSRPLLSSPLVVQNWNAYPLLAPIRNSLKTKISLGLYYPNAFEQTISVMEGSIFAALNTVRLVIADFPKVE
jgi:hypothetical protein